MTVCEGLLRDFKFELPGTAVSELTVSKHLIDNREEVLEEYRGQGSEITDVKVAAEAGNFIRDFESQHTVRLVFRPDALKALAELRESENMSVLQLCQHLFKDYQFGLKLIEGNTGQREFFLDETAIRNPDKYLSDMVVASYGQDAPATGEDATGEAGKESE
jgi:ATP-dependent Clp protease ATP-binding subunit ClpX